jgi:hypothetical protein
MTASDPQDTAEEIAAQWFRDCDIGSVVTPFDFARGVGVVAFLRDAGFLVVRLDEKTREQMVEAGAAAITVNMPKAGVIGSAFEYQIACQTVRQVLDAALSVVSNSTTGSK